MNALLCRIQFVMQCFVKSMCLKQKLEKCSIASPAQSSGVNGCRQNESPNITIIHSSPAVNIWRRQNLKQIHH